MTDALGWIAAIPALVAAIVMLLAPGLITLAPLRLGLIARAALAGAASIVSIGVAGVVFSAAGLAFAVWQPFVVALAGGVVAWALRRHAPRLPTDAGTRWPIVLSGVLAGAAVALVAFVAVPSPSLVSQTYDNVFHLSAIASILEHGDASSFTLRTLIETDRSFAFYPSGWHSLVASTSQLSGASIPIAVNASWIAVSAVLWLPGVAWLAQVCLPAYAPRTVALVALPLGAASGAMPYALLTWGTLYPTFLATTLLPVAVAVPVLAWRLSRDGTGVDRRRALAWGIAGTALTALAVAFGQPRVLVTWLLLLAVPALAVVVLLWRSAWRAGEVSRRRAAWALGAGMFVVVVVAAAGFWYLVVRLGLFTRPLDDRLGGPQAQAVQPVWEGLWQVLSQSWLTGVGPAATWPSILLAISIVVGSVVAFRHRDLRWIAVTYVVIAVLFALAAGSDDVITKLTTALWYKDKFRLSSALPVLGVTLATLGVLTVSARWRRSRARERWIPVVIAWTVAASAAVTLMLTGVSAAVASVFHLPAADARNEVVSQAQIDFFAGLGDVVPADQRVLGDPWDGSGWTLVFGDREPVFPHVNGQWDAERRVLAWQLADIDTDPAVCAALDRLRVRYVTYAPHAFGGGDPAGNHFPGPHAAVDAGLFSLVSTDGDTRLYRIDQCGPLP